MVDFDHLATWPINKIISARGFVCQDCGKREAILYTSTSLEEALRKLKQCPPGHRQFQYLLARCARKAEALRQRGETDGTQQRSHMAPAGPLG